MKADQPGSAGGLRLAKVLQLAGAVWVFGCLGFFVFGLLARRWLNLEGVTAAWPVDVSKATRMEPTALRFVILAPGFLLAAAGYAVRRRLASASGPEQVERRPDGHRRMKRSR